MNMAAANSSPGMTILSVLFFAALLAAYWVPSIVAGTRHVRNLGSVIVINLLLGWTVIGWIVALAMACRSKDQEARA